MGNCTYLTRGWGTGVSSGVTRKVCVIPFHHIAVYHMLAAADENIFFFLLRVRRPSIFAMRSEITRQEEKKKPRWFLKVNEVTQGYPKITVYYTIQSVFNLVSVFIYTGIPLHRNDISLFFTYPSPPSLPQGPVPTFDPSSPVFFC